MNMRSTANHPACFGDHFLAGYWLNGTRSNRLKPALRFDPPKDPHLIGIGLNQTLDQLISEECPCFSGKTQSLLGELIKCDIHICNDILSESSDQNNCGYDGSA